MNSLLALSEDDDQGGCSDSVCEKMGECRKEKCFTFPGSASQDRPKILMVLKKIRMKILLILNKIRTKMLLILKNIRLK